MPEMEDENSEHKYAELFDNLNIGVYRNTPGPDGRFLECNNKIVEIFEAGSKEEFLKHKVRELYANPAQRQQFSDKVLRFGSVKNEELELVTLKGKKFIAALTVVTKKNKDGETYFDGTIEDITERLKAEKNQAMLAAIVASSDDAIIGKTLEGIITSWNKGAENIYGYSSEEAVGCSISILAVPGHEGEMINLLNKIKGGQAVEHLEVLRVRKDGRQINVLLTISPIKDAFGNIVGYSTIAHDITEQKKREEKLLELLQAVEQSGSIVVITDTAGNIEYVNPKFTQITGYSREDAIGKNPRILKSGETPPEEYKKLWDTITSGGTWRGEFHNKRKDGGFYWESATISPARDTSNKITHFMAIKEDITAQRNLQDELNNKIHDLERFNKIAVGRELKMVDLKKRIKELEESLKEQSK